MKNGQLVLISVLHSYILKGIKFFFKYFKQKSSKKFPLTEKLDIPIKIKRIPKQSFQWLLLRNWFSMRKRNTGKILSLWQYSFFLYHFSCQDEHLFSYFSHNRVDVRKERRVQQCSLFILLMDKITEVHPLQTLLNMEWPLCHPFNSCFRVQLAVEEGKGTHSPCRTSSLCHVLWVERSTMKLAQQQGSVQPSHPYKSGTVAVLYQPIAIYLLHSLQDTSFFCFSFSVSTLQLYATR